MDNIRGKTVAITGAARGIGYATARHSSSAAPASSSVTAKWPCRSRRSQAGRSARHRAIRSTSPRDSTRRSSTRPAPTGRPHRRAHQQRRRHAGRPVPRTVRAVDPLLYRGQLLRRVHRCQLALPEMVKRRRGHIVNIASMAGMIAVPAKSSTRHEVRRRRADHGDGRRVRAAGRRRDVRDADLHQHRADHGHPEHRGPQAGANPRTSPPRSSRRSTSPRPTCPSRPAAVLGAVTRCWARAAALAVQQMGNDTCSWTSTAPHVRLRAPRAGRARRGRGDEKNGGGGGGGGAPPPASRTPVADRPHRKASIASRCSNSVVEIEGGGASSGEVVGGEHDESTPSVSFGAHWA